MVDDASRVVVSIEAQTQQLEQGARRADQVFGQSMTDIERSASNAERQIVNSSGNSARALERIRTSSGATRAGMQQLSFQLSDVAQGFALGVSPMTIFAQQSGQVIQALQLMGTEAGGIIGFLGGPWGVAFSAAISVAGALATSLFNSESAGKAAERGYNAAADGADRLAESIRKINGIGTTVAMQDLQNVQDQISVKEIEITKLQNKLVGGPTVTGRSANLGLQAPADVATQRQLAAAKADLANLQANEKLAQARLQVQQRIQTAQDTYNKSRSGSSGHSSSGGSSRATPRENAQQFDLIAEAAKGATDAVDALSDALAGQPAALTQAQQSAFSRIIGNTDDFDAIVKSAQTAFKAEQDAHLQGEAEMQRIREENVRTTANLYYDLFSGGTHRLWQDFERIGLQIISKLLAEWTINSFAPQSQGGKGGGLGGLLGSLAEALGIGGGGAPAVDVGGITSATNSLLDSGLPGLASGGSGIIGGRGGVDQNVLSINGRKVARVGQGELLSVTPRAAMGPRGGTVVHQYFTLDARGGITTKELLQSVDTITQQRAAQAGSAAYHQAITDAPGKIRQTQVLGNG